MEFKNKMIIQGNLNVRGELSADDFIFVFDEKEQKLSEVLSDKDEKLQTLYQKMKKLADDMGKTADDLWNYGN